MLKRRRKRLLLIWSIVFFALAGYYIYSFLPSVHYNKIEGSDYGPEAVMRNYGPAINESARIYKIPPYYLAALCMLESGGAESITPRFEKHIYYRLLMLQKGLLAKYEHVKGSDIKNAQKEALENLASSWGPFQIMGYKCLLFNITVKELRGERSIYWGARWIDTTYGKFIRKGDFKSAFHMHNAGSPFPKNGKARTYDPMYVDNGLKWMAYFKDKF